MEILDRSSVIFGNQIDKKTIKKATKSKNKYVKKFGDDSKKEYHLGLEEIPTLDFIGAQNLVLSDKPLKLPNNPVVVGNIRMGFGHYRISIALASCAKALGYDPIWMDLASFDATGSKMIRAQNDLYSLASRISQKSKLFNHFIWEPLNSEGFRQITYNAVDQKNSELLAPLYHDLPKDVPFVATHVWPSQGAVHAGLNHVVNSEFQRMSYTKGIELLQEAVKNGHKFDNNKIEWGMDLQSEHERYLTEEVVKGPLFLIDYPKDIKAFYMRLNDDGKTVAACDLLVPMVGELVGGSQREERYDILKAKMEALGNAKELDWYLDTRRYGGCRHSGFGIGFDRLLMYITGMTNIRDVQPYPRTSGSIKY